MRDAKRDSKRPPTRPRHERAQAFVADGDRYYFGDPIGLRQIGRILRAAPNPPFSVELDLGGDPARGDPRALVERLARNPGVRAVTFLSAGSPARRGWNWPLDVAVHGTESPPEWVAEAEYANLRRVSGFRSPTLVELALLPMSLAEATRLETPAPLAPVHTVVVMATSPATRDELQRLDALRSRWRADAAVALRLPAGKWQRWLGALTRELAHDLPLDAAVFAASAEVKGPLPLCVGKKGAFASAFLSAHAKRALPKLRDVPDAPALLADIEANRSSAFGHESTGATRMAGIAAAAAPRPRELRHVFADLYRQGKEVDRGEAGQLHQVRVQIRGPGAGVMAAEPLVEPPDWVEGETHRLHVMLQELRAGAKAHVRPLTLPPHGPSSIASFDLKLRDAPEFRARITVLEKPARIVQVLEYRVPIGPAGSTGLARPSLTAEVELRDVNALDGARSPVLASAVIGGREGEDLLSLIRRGEGIAVPLSSFDPLVQNVSALLDAFADGQKASAGLGKGESLDLLRSLADEGVQLREALAAQWGAALEGAPHIQLVSADVNRLLPLEVCYDGPAPRSKAKLCTKAVARLAEGRRDCACPRDSTEVVCPLRFWGLSRVIERHGPDPRWASQLGGMTAAMAGPIRAPKAINLKGRVVWAMDAVVDSDGAGGTLEESKRHEKALEKELQADFVKVDSWAEWEKGVKERTSIVAAVVHNDDQTPNAKALYLNGEPRSLGQVDATLVGPGSTLPVVVLLGCKTLGPSATSFQPAFRFKIKAVPAVVATQAPVIGRFAADCAHELVLLLREQSDVAPATPMGEVLRRARGRLLSRGLTTALAIVALGDADQLIGKEA